MPASPRRLRLLAQLPAARLRAGALPITYARIRTEPSATDRARTRAAHPRASRPSSLGLPSEGGPLLASRGGSFLASVEASRISAENALFVEGGGSGSGDLGRSAARRGFATLRTLVVEAVGTVGNPQGLSKGRWASSPWSLSTGPAISTAPPRGPGVLARLMRCTVWNLPLASESAADPLPPLSTKSQKTPVTSSSLERRPVLWPETTSHHSSDDPSCGQR
jgi:hypothetical protein